MSYRSAAGFTLVELMVVILVIGILTSIALPSYREQVNKGNRAEARALMYEVLQKEERFFSENGRFSTTITDLGYPATLKNKANSHTITLAVGATGNVASSVNVVATASNDAKCATLTLTNAQQTTATGTTPSTCW